MRRVRIVGLNPSQATERLQDGCRSIANCRHVRHELGNAVVGRANKQRPVVIAVRCQGCSGRLSISIFERMAVDDCVGPTLHSSRVHVQRGHWRKAEDGGNRQARNYEADPSRESHERQVFAR